MCCVKGLNPKRPAGTNYYPSAVRFLPFSDPLRQDFAREFDKVPMVKKLSSKAFRPDTMDSATAIREATQPVEEKFKKWKKVPAIAGPERQTDFVEICMPDPAHALSHFVKDMHLILAGDFDKANDSKRKNRDSDARGWELDDRDAFRSRRFAASFDNRERIDKLIADKLRGPSEWVKLIPCLSSGNSAVRGLSVRITERLAHISDAGKYIIGLTDAGKDIKKGFIDALDSLEELLKKKTFTEDEVKKLEFRLATALCKLEILLPFKWNTISRHLLLHLPSKFYRHGSFWSANMLSEERFHKTVRKLVHNSMTNLAASMARNYNRFQNTHLDWGLKPDSPVKSHFLRPPLEFSNQR